jgi:hypothetical protein
VSKEFIEAAKRDLDEVVVMLKGVNDIEHI